MFGGCRREGTVTSRCFQVQRGDGASKLRCWVAGWLGGAGRPRIGCKNKKGIGGKRNGGGKGQKKAYNWRIGKILGGTSAPKGKNGMINWVGKWEEEELWSEMAVHKEGEEEG